MTDLPDNVSAYKDRHGKTRYRFRCKGMPSRSLPGQPGEPRFQKAYAAAARGAAKPKRRQPFAPRTLAAAWAEMRAGVDWKENLKPGTRHSQTLIAERFFAMSVDPKAKPGDTLTFGQMPFEGLRRRDIKTILGRFPDHPHAADAVLRLLRKLMLVAVDNEWIKYDPTYQLKFHPKTFGHRSWTDDELAQFEKRWAIGTTQRLGYALALYTGQRRGDLVGMTWAAFDGTGIALVQEKTDTPLWVPAHPELRNILDQTPRIGDTIIVTAFGNTFAKESFGNYMAETIGAAGLPDECRLHGLRKSAGRSLAEAGCTAHEIMSVLGHKTLSEAQRYTRDAEQRGLAMSAMEKWSRPKLQVRRPRAAPLRQLQDCISIE